MNVSFPNGIYLQALPYFLLGYAVGGRAFAYLGVPPLYMGEVLLLIGLVQLTQSLNGLRVLLQPQIGMLFLFMLWSAMQTVPYIPEYGVMALRDAALWGYGLFALIIAVTVCARPDLLLVVMQRYRFFVRFFPFIAFAGLIALTLFKRAVVDVSLFMQMKPGDVLVHMTAVTIFSACGLAGRRTFLWALALMGAILFAGSEGRGGLLAFSLATSIIVLLRLRRMHTWKTISSFIGAMMIFSAAFLSISHINAPPEPTGRTISPEQLGKNMMSIVVPADQWGLEGTKRYRLEWWNKIIDYTVHGDYFIAGKGYGINLAESDNQLIDGDLSLRNPHNVHLTILARSGVPGLVLWAALNAVWVFGVIRCIISSKFARYRKWEGWFCTLLAFYIAAMVNASFDVYLEGPMGGIWFWTVFGIGIASIRLYWQHPELLVPHEDLKHP